MKTVAILLPFVTSAIFCSAASIAAEQPSSLSDVTWKQTKSHPTNAEQGGLGSSVEGHFPNMSSDKIGMGCGLNWKDGEIHAGFDGGDPNNGVGGGFTWMQHALSSIVGVHYKDTKINLNLTITEQNEVLFSVDGKNLDWGKVVQQQKTQDQPTGKDAGSVQHDNTKPYPLGRPVYIQTPSTAKQS